MNGCFLSGSLQVPLPPNPFDQLVLHPVVYRLPFGTHSHLLLRVPNFTNFILVSLQMLLKNLTVFICRFLVQSSCASGYILELSKLLLHVCILHSYTTTFSIPLWIQFLLLHEVAQQHLLLNVLHHQVVSLSYRSVAVPLLVRLSSGLSVLWPSLQSPGKGFIL